MKSVGQILFNERKRRKLNLDNIQKAIKIHPKYIKALEEDDYSVFDGKTHAKGFLKIYSEFLGLNVDEMMALWRREYQKEFELNETSKKKYKVAPLERAKIVFSPILLLVVTSIVLIVLFFGYLFYQYKNYSGNPMLQIDHPENNLVTENSLVDIVGKTDLDSSIFINNEKVLCNAEGNFATSVKLNEGINTLSVLSVNSLEKKTEKILTIIYRPEEKETVVVERAVEESTPSELLEEASEDMME